MRIKIKPADLERTRAIRGSYYITQHGDKQIARGWPKKPKNPDAPYKKYRQGEFSYAAHWATTPEPIGYITAIAWAHETLMMPRDVLISASYGNLIDFIMPDGTQLETRTMVTPNPQLMLEMITDQPGAMVVRGPTMWEGLLPGSAGYVLTMKDGLPDWEPSTGGGGGGATIFQTMPSGVDSDAYSTKGVIMEPERNWTLNNISFAWSAQTPYNIDLRVVELSTLTISDVLYGPENIVLGAGGVYTIDHQLTTPVDLEVGKRYAVIATLPTGAGTTSLQVYNATGPYIGAAMGPLANGYCRAATIAPAVGTTLSSSAFSTKRYAFTLSLTPRP